MKSTASSNCVLQSAGNPSKGEKKSINTELWQACAGPLVNLPVAGTHVVYFPQGHSEQVAASLKKGVDAQIPNYPNLPSKLLCVLHNVTLHADPETDEVYAQMTLQPVPSFDKEALLRSDLSLRAHKPQTEFFCKTLTASDTSTHGGFSVPRRAAEKILPSLDFSMQPPAQELVARDLHDNVWTFRHIFRGQPKRHLLTSGWSLFVNGKRLFAGDSVLFIRDEKQQLLLTLRRANRQPSNLSSSVLSSDSMHIGVLAAAAHAAANNSPFTVFYNPRASSSEFVIPLAKYYKAFYGQQTSPGLRFRMMFETEESGTRRYMGTITGVNDLDPVRWKNSQWRNLQVGWDESTAGERRTRVSAWEIEPVMAPFFVCPPFLGQKRPRLPGIPDDDTDLDNLYKRTTPWLGDDPHALTGLSLMQWINMQQNPSLGNPMQSNFLNGLPGSTLQSRSLAFTAPQVPQQTSLKFDSQRPVQSVHQLDQFQKSSEGLNPLSSLIQSQQQLCDFSQQPKTLPLSQVQSQGLVQNHNSLQQLPSRQNHHLQGNPSQMLQQQQILGQNQQQSLLQARFPDLANQQAHVTDNQIQVQLLQRLQQQQQSLLSQQQSNNLNQFQEPQRALLDVSQSFSKPLPHLQMLDMPQTQIISQQITKSNSQRNLQFSQPSQVPKLQACIMPEMQGQPGLAANPMSNHLSTAGSSNLTGAVMAGQSGITDEIPSCSTSPSTNNCPSVANANFVKDLHQKTEVKPSVNIATIQNQGHFRQSYNGIPLSQMDYLDSSSATSVSLSQNDITRHSNSLSNPQSILLGDTGHDLDIPLISDMLTENIPGSNKNFSTNVNVSSGCMISNYESTKEAQQELSSSMVTQSFGVPDNMAFNSIDSAISGNSFMNRGAWAQPPQYQRMRTYTKVYKRGAVGRSIDVTRYSGYEELKQDLARMFGVEGQMEDRRRVGWKLVYVDLENDVLLVGDDPWEDFVNCVRCIKILSPPEVQQMSLEGDFGNASLPKQACSSSDGGNV